MSKKEIKKPKWNRLCPKCNKELSYLRRWAMVVANRNNSVCKSCTSVDKIHSTETKKKQSIAKIGKSREPFSTDWKNNLSKSRIGKKHSAETKMKIGNAHRGKVVSTETRIKIGKSSLGRTPNNETRGKLRKAMLHNIENRYGKVYPNYNKNSISILEAKAKKLGITDLQHAENGGEFYIKELGYFVDGYSKEKNIVIEYYEKSHEKCIERDNLRKDEIIKYLECEFIIIKE